jgi:hypothetical protein
LKKKLKEKERNDEVSKATYKRQLENQRRLDIETKEVARALILALRFIASSSY